jgi:hypothetical protein
MKMIEGLRLTAACRRPPTAAPDAGRSPLSPLGGNAELSRIELLPLASLGENKEFEPIPLRGTAQLRIRIQRRTLLLGGNQ